MSIRYNWPAMVREIMNDELLTQADMAAKLNVSQQSISNWLNGTRNPSSETIPVLLKLAQDGPDIGSYGPDPEFDQNNDYPGNNKRHEIVKIFELYDKMGETERRMFITYAESMAQ